MCAAGGLPLPSARSGGAAYRGPPGKLLPAAPPALRAGRRGQDGTLAAQGRALCRWQQARAPCLPLSLLRHESWDPGLATAGVPLAVDARVVLLSECALAPGPRLLATGSDCSHCLRVTTVDPDYFHQ